jgi:hypothetical protein
MDGDGNGTTDHEIAVLLAALSSRSTDKRVCATHDECYFERKAEIADVSSACTSKTVNSRVI